MQTETFDDRIIPHDEFVEEMERDKRARYAKGTAALIITFATVIMIAYTITQLAAGSAVFTN